MDKPSSLPNQQYVWNLGSQENKPISVIVVGMAGSGKTTLMQRLNAHVHTNKIPSYLINLDPAVASIPYTANIDIRESLNYKEVMKTYSLGPNGGILTSLNLFATRFDQVMGFVEKRAPSLKYIFLDTPGQIEVFNWSASGAIITEAFATIMPTVYVFVVDTPRCINTQTFASNMLYACSLFYKSRLPLIVVFTKTDITKHGFALEWMKKSETFEEACKANSSYMGSFTQSMSLMIGEFYDNFPCVGVSAVTGEGIESLFEAIQKAALDYESGYKVELDQMKQERQQQEEKRQREQIEKVKADLNKPFEPKTSTSRQKVEDMDISQLRTAADEYDEEGADDDDDDGAEKIDYQSFMKILGNQ